MNRGHEEKLRKVLGKSMSKDLGYTQEELLVMLDYFAKQTDIIEAKERQLLEDGRIFRYVES